MRNPGQTENGEGAGKDIGAEPGSKAGEDIGQEPNSGPGANLRKPSWLKKKIVHDGETHRVKALLHDLSLHTVCKSARCPNLSECYHHKRATFMILGDRCTRGCRFCSVDHAVPDEKLPLDREEPARLRDAVRELGLRYVVITSVTRDDLEDGGAGQFAACVGELRRLDDSVRVEVLTPDFQGDTGAIDLVAETGPDVYNHNLETVPRLYNRIRPQARYERSLGLLKHLHLNYQRMYLKSGIMVGLGEKPSEVKEVLHDLRDAGCSAVTIGQYLRPTRANVPVAEYVTPERFEQYAAAARELGFSSVASGPFVRSSYLAHRSYEQLTGSC
jgi:lipoic acid synthetase